jgi:hypothetical protein
MRPTRATAFCLRRVRPECFVHPAARALSARMRNPGAVSGVGEFTPSVEGNEEQPDIVPGQLLVAGSGEVLMGSPIKFDRAG